MVVDSVSDVMMLKPEQIQPAPRFGGALTSYLTGLASADDRMMILVDIEKLMAVDELAGVETLAA
jgi:purine-binding chemotaxis protein CheW